MRTTVWTTVLCLLWAIPSVSVAENRTPLALLSLEANPAAADQAPGVGSLLASKLAEAPKVKLLTQADITTALGIERQKQLFSKDAHCTESACMAELSGALGTRYVVSGRLDRFGRGYVLTATVFDSDRTVSLSKPRAEAATESDLPSAANLVAEQVLTTLGIVTEEKALSRKFSLGLKVGNTFLTSLASSGLGGDIDIGYTFYPGWMGFIQVGVTFVRAQQSSGLGGLNVLPTLLGVKNMFRLAHKLQPYWGVGLGVQLAIGQWGFLSDAGALPNVYGIFGAQYLFHPAFGVLCELSTNLAQAAIGLTRNGLGGGFNLELNLGIVTRF